MIRRRSLIAAAATTLSAQTLSWAQDKSNKGRGAYVAQIYDTSLSQQDVSRDFVVGSRCAWQELERSGSGQMAGIRYKAIEVDGSAANLDALLRTLLADPACLALSGTVGQTAARWVAHELDKQSERSAGLMQIAPWLHDVSHHEHSLRAFADHESQIGHALKTLAVVGLKQVGVVFANVQEQQSFQPVLQKLATNHRLQIRQLVANQGFYPLGLQLDAGTPAVLLFMSGTPELAQFSKGASKNGRHRYAVAMADVNAQTLHQMGIGASMPVVITQVVPLASSPSPLVRDYKQALSRFFDEPPGALSLSGYISAKITQKFLIQTAATSRTQIMAAAQRKLQIDLQGFVFDHNGSELQSAYVTQSMLTHDGRIIG
jgi:hypothetical protein